MKHFTLVVILIISLTSNAQSYRIFRNDTINRIDKYGLRFGRWINFNSDAEDLLINEINSWIAEEGYYKIISLNDTNILDSYSRFHFVSDAYYKKNYSTFYCSGHYKNSYSVRDGYWIVYHSSDDKIDRIDLYNNGTEIHSKHYSDGKLSNETYHRIIERVKVTDTYRNLNSFMYRRDYWAKTDNESDKTLYYPNSPISITNCEIRFSTTISHTDTAIISIISNSEEEIIIDSVSSTNHQVTLLINDRRIPPETSNEIKILYTPDRYDLRKHDTVSLYTTSIFPYKYEIFLDLKAYDLAYKNAEKISVIELKKVMDNPLIFYICDVGWHSWVEIKNSNNELVEKFFIREGGCKNLDVSGYQIGEYNIHVKTGTDKSHDYKLILI